MHDRLSSINYRQINLKRLIEDFGFIFRTILLIMREMIQTERDYVKSLEYIIEVSDFEFAITTQREIIDRGGVTKPCFTELHTRAGTGGHTSVAERPA